MKTTTLSLILVLLPHWELESSVASSEAQFRATGQIKANYYGLGEAKLSTATFDFVVRSRGALWLIRTVPHAYLTNRSSCLVKYYECGTDGANVYHVIVFNEDYDQVAGRTEFISKLESMEQGLQATGANSNSLSRIRQIAAKSGPQEGKESEKPKNGAVSEITPGDMPVFRFDDLIAPIWLAYCSANRFLAERVQLAPALFLELPVVFSRSSNLFARVECAMSEQRPKLPSWIDFLDDGLCKTSRDSPWPKLRNTPTSDRGSTNAIYRVTKFRDCDGLQLPAEFALVKFSTNLNGSGKEFAISGALASATLSTQTEAFVPAVSVVSRVEDNRFTHSRLGRPAGYFAEPMHWPTMNEVISTREYKHSLHQVMRDESASGKFGNRRLILYLLFVLLFIAPVVGYAMIRSRRKKTTEN